MAERRPTLTASARAGVRNLRSGRKKACGRRQRKRSLAKVCEVARKAGADHVITDGVVIAFSPAAAVPESSANEWDAVLENDHDPH